MPRKRDACRLFSRRSGNDNKFQWFPDGSLFIKGAEAPKGMQRPALLRCNRIGCPSETITQYRHLGIAEAFVPSFPQKALHTFKIFTKNQPYLHTPASWDECLEKETHVDFFRDEAVTITSSRGFQTVHYLPKERKLQRGCNALRCCDATA